MIHMKHKTIIAISGIVWFAIGFSLLRLGLHLLALRGDQLAVLLMAAGLIIGFFKGRFVLGKTALKGINRIESLPEPMPISQIYTPQFYGLIGFMIVLGMSIKYFGLGNDIRGTVDVAIGAALLNGSTFYFRHILNKKS